MAKAKSKSNAKAKASAGAVRGKFEVYKNAQFPNQYGWRLKAGNGEIIAQGEAYADKDDCFHAIDLVMEMSSTTPVVDLTIL